MYEVSRIRYQVSGFRYEVSCIRYQLSAIRYQRWRIGSAESGATSDGTIPPPLLPLRSVLGRSQQPRRGDRVALALAVVFVFVVEGKGGGGGSVVNAGECINRVTRIANGPPPPPPLPPLPSTTKTKTTVRARSTRSPHRGCCERPSTDRRGRRGGGHRLRFV